jgi:hypothetical protein
MEFTIRTSWSVSVVTDCRNRLAQFRLGEARDMESHWADALDLTFSKVRL